MLEWLLPQDYKHIVYKMYTECAKERIVTEYTTEFLRFSERNDVEESRVIRWLDTLVFEGVFAREDGFAKCVDCCGGIQGTTDREIPLKFLLFEKVLASL